MVGGHHVVVGVMRKMRAQSIARLARIAVTDAVREDDEITSGIEHRAVAVAYGFANGPIVKLQFRQGLTAAEVEVFDDEVALFRFGKGRLGHHRGSTEAEKYGRKTNERQAELSLETHGV